jgi:hypothetical protein
MRVIALVIALLATPALADGSTYWLNVYTSNWAHVFGEYADKASCDDAAKAYDRRWVFHACVPVPPAVPRP